MIAAAIRFFGVTLPYFIWYLGVMLRTRILHERLALADVVYAFNVPVSIPYGNQINAQVHRISYGDAVVIASLIVKAASDIVQSEAYVAACIMQESRFDPECFNHNLSATNPTPSFVRTDWGLCQISGSNIPSTSPNDALDRVWAMNWFTQEMKEHIAFARMRLAQSATFTAAVQKLNTTPLTAIQWCATLFYNRGETGGVADILSEATDKMKHPYRVAAWTTKIATALATNKLPWNPVG